MKKSEISCSGKLVQKICLVLLLLLIVVSATAQQRLFHIDRSRNKNIVCYDVNLDGNKLHKKKPVIEYWERLAEDGRRESLSFFEKQFAFGYHVIKADETEAIVKLKAYKKREVRIHMHKGKWIASTIINGKECRLTRIKVKSIPPKDLKVEYVELCGTTLKGNKEEVERIEK